MQPPLAYYRKIIRDNKFNAVQIIAEDTLNPCVEALCEFDEAVFWKKQTEQEDIVAIINATNLVIGYGTFGFTLALANKKLQRLFSQPVPALVFGPIQDSELADTQITLYSIKNYIKIGDWNCSNEQLELMLTLTDDNVVQC